MFIASIIVSVNGATANTGAGVSVHICSVGATQMGACSTPGDHLRG